MLNKYCDGMWQNSEDNVEYLQVGFVYAESTGVVYNSWAGLFSLRLMWDVEWTPPRVGACSLL